MYYDAVLFDFDGVVVETPSSQRMYAALGRTYEKLGRSGPAAETFQELMQGDFEAIANRCRTLEIDTDVFCTQAARELIQTQLADVERGVRSVFDDVRVVRSIPVSLGVVSDNHPTVVTKLLDRFGLRSVFETVYGCPLTPDGLARRKPNPTNIETAMETLEADSALYVGDRGVDVQAAANAGIDSVLLSRENRCSHPDDTSGVDPTYHCSSLTELPPLLES
ncbi:phosphoglycolate phosphatase [Natronorubrum sediminis]|uniref:Phosphoglycolate phosphatase n=1 Tax=Natronorubrum sediminis TaxID=640943 RepID=A0A1H6FVN2_9EURY|nr:HAD family hydrolase [Natronorubrum sediminis]SEH14492.1 phosphoglycolate phosphatase [Natronorubrum sediminis]